MKKSALTLLILILLISVQSFAQEFRVPENYTFKSKEDYYTYEKDVIEGINWLVNTPISSNTAKRKEVNAFLMKWLSGSPYVTIELSQDIVTFMDCPDCLMVFLGGWTKYALENKDNSNKIKGNLAGIESLIEFYKKNQDALGKNKAIQKYIKLQEKDKLLTYIESRV